MQNHTRNARDKSLVDIFGLYRYQWPVFEPFYRKTQSSTDKRRRKHRVKSRNRRNRKQARRLHQMERKGK
jgi:hypothetical protein